MFYDKIHVKFARSYRADRLQSLSCMTSHFLYGDSIALSYMTAQTFHMFDRFYRVTDEALLAETT